MNKNLFTYKKSGVNIDAADKFISFISNISSKNRGNKSMRVREVGQIHNNLCAESGPFQQCCENCIELHD